MLGGYTGTATTPEGGGGGGVRVGRREIERGKDKGNTTKIVLSSFALKHSMLNIQLVLDSLVSRSC